jgi:hypothetical protein
MTEDSPPDAPPEDGPWAIKLISGAARQMAVDAAKRQRRTVGEWLAEAIRAHVESERESRDYDLFPPGQALATTAASPLPPLSVHDIGEAIDIASRIAALQGRDKPPQRLLAAAQRALRNRIA